MNGVSRRFLLWQGALFAAPRSTRVPSQNETVYRFSTAEWEVMMSVTFFDRYASSGFWFQDRRKGGQFCLSADGRQGAGCLPGFTGAVAIAQYRMRPAVRGARKPEMRECVRTIDQDDRLKTRPPFESAIEVRDGVASDIQAFGYETAGSERHDDVGAAGPWCLLRQDLYIDAESSPFLVVHWKHSLDEIRILDVIPGERTRPFEKERKR